MVKGQAATPSRRDVDVAIVGAGSAGIAAGRALVRAGLNVIVLEASGRIGGRCTTDTVTLNAPFDHGAHWLHAADSNPLVKFGHDLGFSLYPDPRHLLLQSPDGPVQDEQIAAYRSAVETSEAAIIAGAERGDDVAALASLPRELGDWRLPVAFRLGAYDVGKPLSDVSVLDFARAASGEDILCRAGLGTLLATLGRGLPLAMDAAVRSVSVENDRVRLDSAQGEVQASVAIITASTDVLASEAITFAPKLDSQHQQSFAALDLADFLHVGIEIAPGAVDIEADTHVFSASKNERTFAALARAGGSDVWYVGTGGIYARELEAAGIKSTIAQAEDWLVEHFGSRLRAALGRSTMTAWGRRPFIGGAWSVAAPGQAKARAALREPHADRVLFAGEAAHEKLWGTVAGAWESGQVAARRAVEIVRG